MYIEEMAVSLYSVVSFLSLPYIIHTLSLRNINKIHRRLILLIGFCLSIEIVLIGILKVDTFLFIGLIALKIVTLVTLSEIYNMFRKVYIKRYTHELKYESKILFFLCPNLRIITYAFLFEPKLNIMSDKDDILDITILK